MLIFQIIFELLLQLPLNIIKYSCQTIGRIRSRVPFSTPCPAVASGEGGSCSSALICLYPSVSISLRRDKAAAIMNPAFVPQQYIIISPAYFQVHIVIFTDFFRNPAGTGFSISFSDYFCNRLL